MLYPEEIHCTNAAGDRLVVRNLLAVCANDVTYERELPLPPELLEPSSGTVAQARLLRDQYIRRIGGPNEPS